MTTLRLVHTETLQLAELQQQDLINTPLDARFNRLARLTRAAFQSRAASISLLLRDREWMKAAAGWDVRELPLEQSLVAALRKSAAPLVVGDLRIDPRFRNHPLVTRAGMRFLAAYPLKDRFQNAIGFLAAYDTKPHAESADTFETLNDLGHLAQRELFLGEIGNAQQQLIAKLDASRRQALLDDLTRLWNRRGGVQLLEQMLAPDSRDQSSFGVCVADVDCFKSINDRHGHAGGDTVLRKIASALVDSIRADDVVCRLGGDEFLLIIPAIEPSELQHVMQRIIDRVAQVTIRTGDGIVRVALSIGGCLAVRGSNLSPEHLIKCADEALYRAKRNGRNQAILAGPQSDRDVEWA